MDDDELARLRKNSRIKSIIGVFLLLAIIYMVISNFGLPAIGYTVVGKSQTCTEVRGPREMTDTVVKPLKVEDTGFKYILSEDKAEVSIMNVDNESGEVTVRLFCVNGNEQGIDIKQVESGETVVFSFLDVDECDLDYLIEPELIKHEVTKTVYVTDSVCK